MELIEREAALTVIEQAAAWGQGHNAIYDDMRDIPSVDAAPVVHGRWKTINGKGCFTGGGNPLWGCSKCRHIIGFCPDVTGDHYADYLYCPMCGRTMKGADEATSTSS